MVRKLFLFIITGMLLSAPAYCNYAAGNFVPSGELPGAGEVRAEKITAASQFLGGPKREARIGDFKLYNDRAGFIIAGTRLQSGVFMYGGVVESAGILKPESGGARWYNLLGDTSLALYKGGDPLMGARMIAPVAAEILEDGSDGEAIVRIKARDAEWPERKEAMTFGSRSLKVKIIVDYILRPDSPNLEIKITILNDLKSERTFSIGQFFLTGDGSNLFAPGHGYDISAARNMDFPVFTSIGGGVSYGWYPETGDMTVEQDFSRRLMTTFGKLKVPGRDSASFSMFMTVGDGGASSVMENMFEHRGIKNYGIVEGSCTEEKSGAPAANTEIHALAVGGVQYSNTDVQPDGSFRLALPPGRYRLQAVSRDRNVPAPVDVNVVAGSKETVRMKVGPPARLEFTVRDDRGETIPAAISFKRIGGAKDPGDFLRFNTTHSYGGGFYKIHFATPREDSVEIRPGKYEVYVSRGPEYEYEMKKLSFAPGESVRESFTLAHVVDTTGYLSGDFHLHSQPSNDVSDFISDKVRALAACGLEVPAATDHDVNTDYMPYIKKLGLERYVKSIVGDELTTIRLGHFNGYPLKFDPDKKDWGAPIWFGMTAPEIAQAFRDDPLDNTIVQINHPRSSSSGYFNLIGYDNETGTASDKKNFTLNFDGMEVLNGKGYGELDMTLPDWYSFLNRGKPVIGFGNSDNHQTFKIGAGYPRNYIVSGTDIAGEMNERDFVAAIHAQKNTVSGGPFITVNINGNTGLGETTTDTDGRVEINVKVQAPSWIDTKTIRLIANGETVEDIDIPRGESVVRFDDVFVHSPHRDTWYIIIVEGDNDLFPVYPGARPYSFTNPVYVDVDGNGKYDPLLQMAAQ